MRRGPTGRGRVRGEDVWRRREDAWEERTHEERTREERTRGKRGRVGGEDA